MSWTVWGISELGCWLGHYPYRWPTGRDAEDCLDAHIACNIRHIVWDLGRSVLNYHSSLPEATCRGLRESPHFEDSRRRAIEELYRERCQLRAALMYARERDCIIYGRLCMNRHYNPLSEHRSRFADSHPELCEQFRDGRLDVTRLTYASAEYRRERVEILAEAAFTGCEGLCLDFCRQPPAVRYHPLLVTAYRAANDIDPRELTLSGERDAFLAWCRYRATSVTQFLVELKQELDRVRERYQRVIPVQVRIPSDGLEGNLVAGLDVANWCEQNLVDEIALSELRWLREYQGWELDPYLALGERHGIPIFAGNSCLPMQAGGWSGECNPRGVNPVVAARRTLSARDAGAAGVSVYQTDLGVQDPAQMELLSLYADPAALEAALEAPDLLKRRPITPENEMFGIDNHSRPMNRLTSADEL
jgi:hypothetical protein